VPPLLCGGMTMERPSPRLTIGALITFQLYFNSVTSSYTALSNCLTSLVGLPLPAVRLTLNPKP
jgi:ABC-type bacteriocin/lantibiotic exporter with double-glycine peptidase domain